MVTMDRLSVESVLLEARALARYAARSGTLPNDSRIFDAVDAITQALERGEHPAIGALIAEMMKVSVAAGVTVEQLMRRETPLGRLRHLAAPATPLLLAILTLLLTLYLAFQSSELNNAELALREYQELESLALENKIVQAWKIYQNVHLLNVSGLPLAQLDGYQKLVEEAKRIYEKRNAAIELLTHSSVIQYLPFESWQGSWRRYWGGSGYKTVASSEAVVSAGADQKYIEPPVLDCSEERLAPEGKKRAPAESSVDLDSYPRSIACFVRVLRIGNDWDYPIGAFILPVRIKIHMLASWLLPALYGLLGACVFVMRDLALATGRIKARGDASVVDLLSLLLRIALGGLAGIIIGWFWTPASSTASSPTSGLSSFPFAIAFLAGYSIDSLFALLDRLIRNFGQPDEKKTSGATKKHEGNA
jgi:hypothetical protein